MAVAKSAVQRTIRVGEPRAAAMNRFVAYFGPWLLQGDWHLKGQTDNTITYGRDYFHTWQIVVAVLGFPIGLIALLAEKDHAYLAAAFQPAGEEATEITLTGAIPSDRAAQIADRIDGFDPARQIPQPAAAG